jgi:hypothetical protein
MYWSRRPDRGKRISADTLSSSWSSPSDTTRKSRRGAAEQQKGESGPGKDVPKNRLINFSALRSFGFRVAHGNNFTVLGESSLAAPTLRTLDTTEGL